MSCYNGSWEGLGTRRSQDILNFLWRTREDIERCQISRVAWAVLSASLLKSSRSEGHRHKGEQLWKTRLFDEAGDGSGTDSILASCCHSEALGTGSTCGYPFGFVYSLMSSIYDLSSLQSNVHQPPALSKKRKALFFLAFLMRAMISTRILLFL
jgi:hypothetical protein